MAPNVLYDLDGHVATITDNRPEARRFFPKRDRSRWRPQ